MKLSFILPVYNCASFLAQTIDSIGNQTVGVNEVIVIDDASTDEIEPIRKFYENHVKWITMGVRSGAAVCRNLGFKNAESEIIFVCDAGDFCLPTKGQEVNKFFMDNPDKHVCYSHVQLITPGSSNIMRQDAVEWNGYTKPPISHPTVAYRREVAEKCKYHEGCLDTDFYEFFLLDCYRAGFNFGFIPRVLTLKTDLSSSDSYRDYHKAKDEKFKKYQVYGVDIAREAV